ncbi:PAS domain S-box protein [Yeosuana sp. AK3]
MSQDKIGILKRALHREKEARKQAEKILEEKATDLYNTNKILEKVNADLESLYTRTDSQLQGVFENIVDAYLIMDLKGNILKMNDAALKLLGFENDKVQFNLMSLVSPSDYERVNKSFYKLLNSGTLTNFEIKIVTNDKVKKYVHVNTSIIYDKEQPVAAQGIIRDITSAKENELIVEVINNIAQSILGKLDIYEIAYEITDKIANYLHTEDCVIYLYSEQDNSLEQIAAYGEKLDNRKQLKNKIILKEGEGVVGHVAKTGIAEIVNNTSIDKRYIVDIIERKSEITVPIKIGDKVIGIIDSEHEHQNFFTNKHLEIIKNIAAIVALQLKSAIDLRDRQRAEEKLISSEKRLITLISSLDSGVLLEDENRKIVLTNEKFCEFFEIPVAPETLIGQDCSMSAELSKGLFVNPDEFVNRISTILLKRETTLGDEVVMLNGKILERDYIPIYKKEIYSGHLWTYKDVTLRRKYRKSIEEQRLKYRGIIANMNLGLLEVDKDDNILMANQSFVKMSGYSENYLVGKCASELFPTEEFKEIIALQNQKRNKGLSNSYELKVKNRSGEIRHWLISGAPNYNINGKVIGSIGVHLDITEIKNLEEQKEKLLKQLEKSNDELHEYAHIVSHDLKSPLRSINALVSWLKEDNQGKFDEVSLQNFELIEATLEKMEGLITDILNYSTVGAESKIEEFNLNNLIHDLISILYIPEHISIKFLNELPFIVGDKTKIHQLFQNLISNAVKFIDKEHGFITIDVEEKEHHYQFSIKDNGMGIEEKHFKKIFQIFHSINKRKDSSGIGLSIVKKIVEMHQGDIWLESEPTKGTAFYFTLSKKLDIK